MEIWVTNDKPSPLKIHAMIIQVAKFLYEFARSVHASPDFLRLGIDLSALNLFCEGLDPEMRGMEMITKKNSSHGECLIYLICCISLFWQCLLLQVDMFF